MRGGRQLDNFVPFLDVLRPALLFGRQTNRFVAAAATTYRLLFGSVPNARKHNTALQRRSVISIEPSTVLQVVLEGTVWGTLMNLYLNRYFPLDDAFLD